MFDGLTLHGASISVKTVLVYYVVKAQYYSLLLLLYNFVETQFISAV